MFIFIPTLNFYSCFLVIFFRFSSNVCFVRLTHVADLNISSEREREREGMRDIKPDCGDTGLSETVKKVLFFCQTLFPY